jgi:uncharacterized protein YprB with RNaseH-like and TPR domain
VSMRLLSLDIETSPALSWHYGMFNQNFGLKQVERKPEMLMWASHWYGEPLATTKASWADEPGAYEDLWDRLDQATHVMGYNSNRFDLPWINAEFKRLGVRGGKPYSPVVKVDLMLQIRKNFRNLSNKLQFTSTHLLGFEGKKDENALDLWLEMYRAEVRGDDRARQRARDRMERYCIQDVRLLPKMYKDLLPWLTGINANLYTDDMDGCPNCPAGPGALERRGYAYTGAGRKQRYRCRKCGTWSKAARGGEFSAVRNAK